MVGAEALSLAKSPWLSLGQAATAIGVHPITLRRWADRGRIPSSRTVGGHRRFLRADVDNCMLGLRRIRHLGGLESRWASMAQTSIRRGHVFDGGMPLQIGPRDRLSFRRTGLRLLSLMADISVGRMEVERARRLARRLGRAYAGWAAHKRVASADMLRALAPIRQTLLEAAIDLIQAENLEPQAVRGLVAALEDLTQAVEIGLIEAVLPDGRPTSEAG